MLHSPKVIKHSQAGRNKRNHRSQIKSKLKGHLGSFLVLDSVNLDLIIDKLINIGDHSGALDVHEDEAGGDVGVQGGVGSGGGAGVHVELVLVLVRLKLVGVTAYQNVTIQLPGNKAKS